MDFVTCPECFYDIPDSVDFCPNCGHPIQFLKQKNIFGEMVEFGSYYFSFENSKYPIEWIVLDKKEDKQLLLSRYAVDCKPFNEEFTEVTWWSCSLKKWLNEDFFNEAFSDEEKEKIESTAYSADKIPYKYIRHTNKKLLDQLVSGDKQYFLSKIFLLSIEELNKYLRYPWDRECIPSVVADRHGAHRCFIEGHKNNCDWWLRTPGEDSIDTASYVGWDGEIYSRRVDYNYKGVRPAMWVKLDCNQDDFEIEAGILKGYTGNSLDVVIPNTVNIIGEEAFKELPIESVSIPDGVTSIGDSAFADCRALKSITIPDSVTEISGLAFYGCTSLENITIPDSVTSIRPKAFYGCSSLTSITIPNSVTIIGGGAFAGCSSLTSITIPDSVTSIVSDAFNGCSSLTSITIPDSVTSIGERAFYNTAYYNNYDNWENDVLYIGNRLIKAKDNLTGSYSVRHGTTSISDYALKECTSLENVRIPNSVTSIGDSAFADCSSLKSINIPNSVTSIGGFTFGGCRSLTSISIPDSVTTLGGAAFQLCTSLEQIIIPGSIKKGRNVFVGCSSLTSITISDGSTSIGWGEFAYCRALKSIKIPNSVKAICEKAFYGCTSLTSITIPEGVTRIDNLAFADCTGLTSINIPDSVTGIGNCAFSGCTGLYEGDINAKPEIKNMILKHISDN